MLSCPGWAWIWDPPDSFPEYWDYRPPPPGLARCFVYLVLNSQLLCKMHEVLKGVTCLTYLIREYWYNNTSMSNNSLCWLCMLVVCYWTQHCSLDSSGLNESFVKVLPSLGMDASVSVKPKQTDMFARLQNIIVTNVDLKSIHKKVKIDFSTEMSSVFYIWDAFLLLSNAFTSLSHEAFSKGGDIDGDHLLSCHVHTRPSGYFWKCSDGLILPLVKGFL